MKRRYLLYCILSGLLIPVFSVFGQPKGNSNLSFSAENDVFNGGLENLVTTTATVELWVKFHGTSGVIFTKMNGTDLLGKTGVALEYPSSSQMTLSVGLDGSRTIQNLSVSTSLETWYHIAVTFNSGTATLYVNGVSKGTSSGESSWNSPYPFVFGSFHPWGSYDLNGEIDDIRIFNTVRTPSEIASDMISSSANGAMAFWTFDEAEGDIVYDESGNGNNGFLGTVNGSPDDNDPAWNVSSSFDGPTNLFAISGNGQLELKWNQTEIENFSQYLIYGGKNSLSTQLLDSTNSVTDTTAIITGLENDSLYYFRVRVKNTDGNLSDYSNEDASIPVELSGKAISFDGIDDYVEIGNPSELNMTGDMTLEAWIYSSDFSVSGRVVSKWGLSSGYELDVAGGNLRFGLNQSVGAQTSLTSFNNQWVHIAATKSGTTTKIYVNGELAITGSTSAATSISSNKLLIGEMANLATSYYAGSIDEVRIWNVARSSSEILNNMNSSLRGDETGLVGLWHFDESSGNIAYDATSFGNNGTIKNGALIISSGAMEVETLPVELSSFVFSNNQLKWTTASETNNLGWEIESRQQYSDGGQQLNSVFEKIGFVSGKGTTTEKQNYSFRVSASSENKMEFRLKQIDSDGKISFSNILSVDLTPSDFELSQNYPNPFNPSTIINFQLPVSGKVELKVFDLLGREVKILVNEEKPAGNYSVDFSAKDFPSGVYYYRLSSGNFSETKKMILMK